MATATKTPNYTPEVTATILAEYANGTPVETIAGIVGKSTRSIVAKLSREGVYVAKTATKAEAKATKADLVAKIAEAAGVDVAVLKSLEKATKEALEILAG